MTSQDTPSHTHGAWTNEHVYLGEGHEHAERRARLAATVTAVFMAVEIGAGFLFGSMALIADGGTWRPMSVRCDLPPRLLARSPPCRHYARFSLRLRQIRRAGRLPSAIILGIAGLGVAIKSVERLLSPVHVNYGSALMIAGVGFVVNVISALLLKDSHAHSHGHAHDHHDHHDHAHDHDRSRHGHSHGHSDHNMRAAYVHVVADAATSLLAIGALGAGLVFGVAWLDPMVGIVGAGVIASWAFGLVRDSGMVLLDAEDDPRLAHDIRDMLETELNARVADLHLWRLGPGHRGLIVSLVSADETTAERIKAKLRERYADLSHVTIEVAVCAADCATPS